jgi:hypothetical protein
MKATLKTITASFILSLLVFSARAFVVFQDNFNYPNGVLTNSTWVAGAGNTLNGGVSVLDDGVVIQETGSSQPRAYFTNGVPGFAITNQIWAGGSGNSINNGTNAYYFGTNTPVAAIYFTYTLNVTSATNSYHAYFCDTNFTLVARIYASTNTATPGSYRIGIGTSTTLSASTNGSGVVTNIIQQDLSFGTSYIIVARYLPASGLESVWVNPANEASSGSTKEASATFTAPWPNISGFGIRSATGTSSESGDMNLGSLIIGTTFADVIPSSTGSNPPFIAVQPQSNTALFAGNNFTNSVLAGGDPGAYQWYFESNSVINAVSGATNASFAMNSVQTNQSGQYFVTVSNVVGVVTSSIVDIQIYSQPIAPSFSVPTNSYAQTNIVGDTVTFSLTVLGVPPPALKWFFVTNGVTNAIAGSNIAGTNSATLTITGVTSNQAGVYFARATNLVSATNSPLITLVVNPIPSVNVAALRTMVNASYQPTNTTSLFTIEGIVTTWTNLTTSGNSEFCIQDNSGGITVFWSGATAGTNLPPGGALVQVTAPLNSFDGLLEIEPVFTNKQMSVTIVSTNNPLPAPQPLPFDPNIVNNAAQMFAMGSTYFVASNVTLQASPSTFTFEANEPITNNAYQVTSAPLFGINFTNRQGQTFIVFYNENAPFLNQNKPAGPVTIYGVLQYFESGGAVNQAGWEFTPTRNADIVSYIHVTNVLTSLTRQGDLVTNTFNQSVLRPGDTLTAYVSIADPEGGTVTLGPSYAGLPADASWSNVTSGQTGTAVFHFSPTAADESSNYLVSLGVSSTSGNTFTNTFSVYVPTPDEQNIYISEIFANPTTNTASRAYNPLRRANDFGVEANIPVQDQYIEIANLSADPAILYSGFTSWTLGNGQSTLHTFDNDDSSGVIQPDSAYVVYGGPASSDPSYPTILGGYPNSDSGAIEPVNASESLGLSTNGGVIALYNQNGELVDRVAYPASALNTSFSRFPTLNNALVPQAYISTNYTTAGFQYDGGLWSAPTKVPVAVTNVVIKLQGTNAIFTFPVNTFGSPVTSQAYTLWSSSSLLNPFSVIYGQGPFTTASAKLTNNVSGPVNFYFITTQ